MRITFQFHFVQGGIFYNKDTTVEGFWDVVEDEKFEVKQPEAKKQKTKE